MAPIPRRIVLTGSESTGKTRLARELAAHLGISWVPEFAREYAAARGGVLTEADVEPIATGQALAEAAAMVAGEAVVFDTDLISTVVYARHYYDSVPAWVIARVRQYPASLYLLCDTDLPWVPDGVRDRPVGRDAIQAEFRTTLEAFGFEPVDIRGAGPERLEQAIAALNQWRDTR